ncbi:MAG: LytR/AlgR family response regulator transcription factor [Bacteroidia bacterium]
MLLLFYFYNTIATDMLKVIIIDDEQNTRDVISAIIRKRCKNVEIQALEGTVKSGIQAIEKFRPDLVLLDIHLEDGSGFDILKKTEPGTFKVIFITAYDEYAVKAFKFSALDYILKPVNSLELSEAINKVAENMQYTSDKELSVFDSNHSGRNKDSKKIILKTLDSIYAVSIKDILHCEADTYYTKFHLSDGQMIMVSNTLKEYDEMLNGFGFFRVHQSHLINLDYFVQYKKADGGFAVLKDGTEIPVALRKKDLFLQAIARL